MLTISKPLSAGQARRYHAEEFSNTRSNYYSAGDRIVGHWHGQLAKEWGLHGEVRDDISSGSRTAVTHSPASSWCAIRLRANP